MNNWIFCKIKRQNALFLKFRQPKRKFISSRDKFVIVFFCSLSKNMNKILSIELFTGTFRQTWLSETLFQISLHLFFEYSNTITNSPKMGLEIKKWKFQMAGNLMSELLSFRDATELIRQDFTESF